MFGEEDEKAKDILKETHLKETLPYYFEKFESMAKNNNGYLVGKKVRRIVTMCLCKLTNYYSFLNS